MTESLDRTTMAFGLEARVPFLDHELIELAAQIPPRLHLRGGREKYLLRRADGRRICPPPSPGAAKRRLRAPVGAWLRGRLPAFVEDLLAPDRLRADGYFDPDGSARARSPATVPIRAPTGTSCGRCWGSSSGTTCSGAQGGAGRPRAAPRGPGRHRQRA